MTPHGVQRCASNLLLLLRLKCKKALTRFQLVLSAKLVNISTDILVNDITFNTIRASV